MTKLTNPLLLISLLIATAHIQAEEKSTDPSKSPYWPKDSYVEAGSSKAPAGEQPGLTVGKSTGSEAGTLKMAQKEEAGRLTVPTEKEPPQIAQER